MTDHEVARPLGWVDTTLVVIFLVGIYLGVSLQITSRVPLTCAPSGFAGLVLLWRRRDRIHPTALAGLLALIALYIASILSASDYSFLSKRFTGLLQLTYSLIIGFALFLTLVAAERRQVARILLAFCLAIAVGCLLEQYAGLRWLSDAVRERIYDAALVYDSDRRDEILYGRIRPKLFTSEPSAVTFGYTYFVFVWLIVSQARWKLAIYAGLMALGLVLMPGPTLLLMLMLAVPYLVVLGGQPQRGTSAVRLITGLALSALLVGIALAVGSALFAERIAEYSSGKDASFFYRVMGPMLVAFDVFRHYPLAGAGLTGEPFIADRVMTVYMNSGEFASQWRVVKVGDVLTNYFWLHWIYLGLVWGTIILVAHSVLLRLLGVPSILFCWTVWVILGQASGAYVGPKTWAVLFMVAAAAVLHRRQPVPSVKPVAPVGLQRRMAAPLGMRQRMVAP